MAVVFWVVARASESAVKMTVNTRGISRTHPGPGPSSPGPRRSYERAARRSRGLPPGRGARAEKRKRAFSIKYEIITPFFPKAHLWLCARTERGGGCKGAKAALEKKQSRENKLNSPGFVRFPSTSFTPSSFTPPPLSSSSSGGQKFF